MVRRVAWATALSCVGLAVIFAIWRGSIAAAIAVLGGGVLLAISFWAIRSTVDAVIASEVSMSGAEGGAKAGESRGKSTAFALVKFFTRHAIVALAAYGMMVRLHLDAVGLLAGVSSLGLGLAVEAWRDSRSRSKP